jgi:transcriptional/translational regulatory protein YebC/TACO1
LIDCATRLLTFAVADPEGNAIVAEIVKTAKSKQWSWKKVESALDKLSKRAGYGEAMDTVVREIFADELGLLD